jgi:hypothetical protein
MVGSVLDVEGGWTFQEGTFEKAKLCRDNGVDVRLYPGRGPIGISTGH